MRIILVTIIILGLISTQYHTALAQQEASPPDSFLVPHDILQEFYSDGYAYNDLKIAFHNVWFFTIFGTDFELGSWGQPSSEIEARARKIVADDYLEGQDIVVLNELFDNGASEYFDEWIEGRISSSNRRCRAQFARRPR